MGLLDLIKGAKRGQSTTISLKRTRKLTPKQLRTLARLGREDGEAYLATILGLHKGNIAELTRERERERYNHRRQDRLSLKGENSVVEMFRNLVDTTSNHRPTNAGLGNWIGVEIECFIPRDEDSEEHCHCDEDEDGNPIGTCCGMSGERARKLLACDIEVARITRCTVKDDGSLSSDEGYSCEIAILLSPSSGLEQLKRLCDLLNDKGCFVNDTCGLHVHLDARHLDKDGVKLIGKRLGATLPVLAQMVPSSRRTNTYCKLIVGKLSDNHDDRYCAINLQAYSKFKTVEVRLHSSTTNFTKIANWISILKTIANTPIRGTCSDFQTFLDKVPMDAKLVEYMDKRITKFEANGSREDSHGIDLDALQDSVNELDSVMQLTEDDISSIFADIETEQAATLTLNSIQRAMPNYTYQVVRTADNGMTVMSLNDNSGIVEDESSDDNGGYF